jgi:4-methyl-5(b-hydroxyethyl)-thiazole monophosphate biosynthesis
MSAKAYLFLAEGFEEIEAITPIDLLRRAGVDVTTVAIGTGDDTQVKGAHGIRIHADIRMKELHIPKEGYDALILPGGLPGASNLAADKDLLALLKQGHASGAWICAICAAPAFVLGAGGAGLLEGRKFTCYPGAEGKAGQGTHLERERLVVDGQLITAIGLGAAAEFSEEIISRLVGPEAAARVHESTIQKD